MLKEIDPMLRAKSSKLLAAILTILIIMALTSSSHAIVWSAETPLTTDADADFAPVVTQAKDGKIWVVWHSWRYATPQYPNNAELMYRTSSDGGSHWSTETRLTNNPYTDGTPSITQTSDGKIWVVWTSDRYGNFDIFFKFSSTGGSSWSSEIPLTTNEAEDITPSITQTSDGKIWVVWTSGRAANDDIWYKTSPDNGATWTDDTQLTLDTSEDRYPSVMQAENGTIWIVWTTDRNSNQFEIYYRTSSNGGSSWSPETRLTRDGSEDMFPSVTQAKDGTIWVVWDSDRIKVSGIPQLDLFYNTYAGATWASSDTQLTTNDSDDFQPEIYQGKTHLWVVWTSNREGNNDIFYKTLFTPVHDVAVTSVTSPSTTYFGHTVSVTVVVKNKGTISETFSVTAYRSGTAIGTQTVTLNPDDSTTLDFPWNTGTATMGARYTISATAQQVPGETDTSDNSLTDGEIHVKILGDIDGDNTVDIYDAIHMVVYFGEPASSYPEADIDGDGYITIYDATYITANYGKTV